MTVSVKWDADAAEPGHPNDGSDTKTYPPGSTSGTVLVTNEQDPTQSDSVTFTLPLEFTGAALTPSVTTVDSTGTAAQRTINVSGTGFIGSTAGTVVLRTGAAGSGGTVVVTANFTTTPQGTFSAVPIVVPLNADDGDYHLVGTVGSATSDDTDITVSSGAVMSTPTNLAAGTVTTTTIPLTWDAVTTPVAAEEYVVRHAPTGTTTWTVRAPVAVATDTITGLTANTGYDIQVKADATGHTDSAWSATVTATTAA